MKTIVLALLIGAVATPAAAADISTHVLDLARGVGGRDVPVTLSKRGSDGGWRKVGAATTDGDGRVRSFGAAKSFDPGVYRLQFDMSRYPDASASPFFPEIALTFRVADRVGSLSRTGGRQSLRLFHLSGELTVIVAPLPITLGSAAALGAINLWLALRIVRMRLRNETLIGDGGNDLLAGRMRAHANLVEYAPFVLVLLALIELARGSGVALGTTASIFVIARIAHPLGMDLRRSNLPRANGAVLTLLVLAFLVGWAALIAIGVA